MKLILIAYLRLDFLKRYINKTKIANFYNQNLKSNVITPQNNCCDKTPILTIDMLLGYR